MKNNLQELEKRLTDLAQKWDDKNTRLGQHKEALRKGGALSYEEADSLSKRFHLLDRCARELRAAIQGAPNTREDADADPSVEGGNKFRPDPER